MKYLVIFLLPISMFSQTISGKIYDSETTVKGIDIFNISKETKAYSDDNGNFTIKASVDDTLSFHSIFHNPKRVRLKKEDFNNTMIIELSKTINRLTEILLQNNIDPNDFNTVKEEQKIQETIDNDSKANPHLYETSSQYGLDFIRLAGLVGKLLKSKKTKNDMDSTITAKDLDSLFNNDAFFNKNLLTRDLKIVESKEQLFYEFCETKGFNKNLMAKDHKLLLLEQLVVLSQDYLNNVEISSEN